MSQKNIPKESPRWLVGLVFALFMMALSVQFALGDKLPFTISALGRDDVSATIDKTKEPLKFWAVIGIMTVVSLAGAVFAAQKYLHARRHERESRA
jgi:hypothetical protein